MSKTILRWALRTVTLWTLTKGLRIANEKLRERQRVRANRLRPAVRSIVP